MKKAAMVLLAATFCISVPCFAETYMESASDVQADVNAVHKDNKVIKKHRSNIEENRASKAKAKAEGDYAQQAIDSVKIGSNKATIGAKQVEKEADHKILDQDIKDKTGVEVETKSAD